MGIKAQEQTETLADFVSRRDKLTETLRVEEARHAKLKTERPERLAAGLEAPSADEIVRSAVGVESTRDALALIDRKIEAAEKTEREKERSEKRRALVTAEASHDRAICAIEPAVKALVPAIVAARAAAEDVNAIRFELGLGPLRDVIEPALLGALVRAGLVDHRALTVSSSVLRRLDPNEGASAEAEASREVERKRSQERIEAAVRPRDSRPEARQPTVSAGPARRYATIAESLNDPEVFKRAQPTGERFEPLGEA